MTHEPLSDEELATLRREFDNADIGTIYPGFRRLLATLDQALARCEAAEKRVKELTEQQMSARRAMDIINSDPDATQPEPDTGGVWVSESLTFEQVHAVNTARCRRWHEDSTAWTGADWATALGGECGEALNIVKKLRRVECGMEPGPNDPPVHQLGTMLADELADVFLYLDLLAWHYGLDLPTAIVSKFNKVSALQGFPEELPMPTFPAQGVSQPERTEGGETDVV